MYLKRVLEPVWRRFASTPSLRGARAERGAHVRIDADGASPTPAQSVLLIGSEAVPVCEDGRTGRCARRAANRVGAARLVGHRRPAAISRHHGRSARRAVSSPHRPSHARSASTRRPWPMAPPPCSSTARNCSIAKPVAWAAPTIRTARDALPSWSVALEFSVRQKADRPWCTRTTGRQASRQCI